MKSALKRCWKTENPLHIKYHDEERGVPVYDDKKLFELLSLEAFQAGLTWELILKRRNALKKVFADFDPKIIADYTETAVSSILSNPTIIRNRAKIDATISNAQKFLEIQKEFGSFSRFVWRIVNEEPIDHGLKSMSDMPSETTESQAMSKELRRRGFKFVGPVICYAFMQAVGLVNYHLISCFRYKEIQRINTSNKDVATQ